MKTKELLRQRIIDRINNLSEDKLGSLEDYINALEKDIQSKSEVLSYSGIFKELDQDFIDDLTINLHELRQSNPSRIK